MNELIDLVLIRWSKVRGAVVLLAAASVVASGCSSPPGSGVLDLEVEIRGGGTVTSQPGVIFCRGEGGSPGGGTCRDFISEARSPVVLKATPAPGYRFVNWTLDSRPSDSEFLKAPSHDSQRFKFTGDVVQAWTAVFEPIVVDAPDAGGEGDAGTDAGNEDGGADAGVMDGGMDGGADDPVSLEKVATDGALALKKVTWFPGGATPDGGTRVGQFIAVAPSGTLIRSEDGLVWTQTGSFPGSGADEHLAASGDAVLAFDGLKKVYRSEDGVNFSLAATLTEPVSTFHSIWANNEFTLLGVNSTSNGLIIQSDTGDTWTVMDTSPFPNAYVLDVAWTGSFFVAVGFQGSVLTSITGDAPWKFQNGGMAATQKTMSQVASNGSLIVAVGGPAGSIETITSVNGATWTKHTTAKFPTDFEIRDLEWTGTYFLAVGTGGRHFTSVDGKVWTPNTPSLGGADLNDISVDGPVIVVVGENGTVGIAQK